MKKKPAASPKPSRKKTTPHTGLPKNKPLEKPNVPAIGKLWDDDLALRVLFKNSSDIFALVDAQGKILYLSPSADRMIGLADLNVTRSNLMGWIWPDDVDLIKQKFTLMLKTPAKGIPFQTRIQNETGSPRWIEGVGTNYLKDPAIEAVLVNYHDITIRKTQELALQESERLYRELFERTTLAIFQSTRDGKIIQVNQEFARMFGFKSPTEVISTVKSISSDLFSDPTRRGEIIRQQEKNPDLTQFENLYRRKDGSTFWGLLNIHFVTDSQGRPLFFEGFIEDINERKQAEKALRESEEKFRSIFNNSSAGISIAGLDLKFLMVNPAFCMITGYSKEELLQSVSLDITHPDDVDLNRKAVQDVLDGKGKNIRFTKRYIHKDGHTVWAEVSSVLVHDAVGKPSHFVTHILDITDQKKTEDALRESEAKAGAMMTSAPFGITFVDATGKLTYANPAAERILGLQRSEIVDRSYDDPKWKITTSDGHPFPPDKLPFARVMVTRQAVYDVEHAIEWGDGKRVLLSINGAPLFTSTGEFTGMVAILQDITERKRAEEALRESEGRYRSLFENSLEGIGLSLGNRIVDANKALLDIFGYPDLEEFRSIPLLDHIAPESKDSIQQRLRKIKDGDPVDERFAYKIIRKDGIVRELEISTSHIKIGGELLTHSTFRDVTERKRAEGALRESEERYRQLVEQAADGIFLLDNDGRFILFNSRMCEMLGYTPDELRGLDIIGTYPAEMREAGRERLARVYSGEPLRFERPFLRKDGTVFIGEASAIKNEGGSQGIVHDITSRKQAGEELQALVLKHETLLAAIPEIVMEVDNQKVYTWANPAGIGFFGEDVIGKEAAFYFEGEQDIYNAVQPVFNGSGGTIYVESWQRRKDGQKRLLAWWCRSLTNNRSEVTGALSTARDITEKRQADEQIQNLSRFPTENPNPVMRMTPDGRLLYANNASRPFLNMWNIEVGQVVPDECRAEIQEVYRTNIIKEIETSVGERIFSCTLTPIHSAEYVNVYGRDITQRKQAEEALGRQAEELRQRNADLARLNELTERRMKRLVSMRAIDIAITSSFKLELVLNILLGQLADLFGTHAADILIFQQDLQTFRFVCGRGFSDTIPPQTYLRKAESYANQAAQERRMIRIPQLVERTDAGKIYPKISGEGFSSYLCIPLLAKGLVKGVMEIFQRESLELGAEEDSFLEMVAGQAAIAIDNSELFEGLQATNDELSLAYNDTLTGWARTLELRNREAEGEAQRLADTTVRLAQALGANENEMIQMYRGAILHDIGVMGIPDSILLKSAPLTEEEWAIVRKHPQFAFDLLSPINYLRSALSIPHCHHEKWDGTGYPRGLKGTQIPFAARVFAVVDVWDALRSDRPYRKTWTDAEARDYIRLQSGSHFDPTVVQAFLEMVSVR